MTTGGTPREATAAPPWAVRLALASVSIALALTYFWPAFRDPEATGFGDWQMVHHNWETAYVALTRYGEVARFDPFHCGGVSVVGNPENGTLAPTFYALALPFGPTAGSKLFVVLHVAFGFASMVSYLRRVAGTSWATAALGGVVFAGSGFFGWHLAGGHATFAPFAFLPGIALALHRAEQQPVHALTAGALFALALVEGGTYPVPYMAVDVALVAYARMVLAPASAFRVLRAVGLAAGVALTLAAYRLEPILATLARLPRTIGSVDASRPAELLEFLTAREHDWHVPGHEFVWPEYGTYVGYPVLLLSLLGAATVLRRGHRSLPTLHLVGLLAACALTLGNASSFHPWPLLRTLPVFDSLRVPSRFLVVATFHLGVLAALGAAQLERVVARGRHLRTAAAVGVLVAIGVAVDVGVVTRPIVDRWDGPPIDATARADVRSFVRGRAYHASYASYPRRNESTLDCYVGAMNWPVSPALVAGDVAQATVTSTGAPVRLLRQTVNSTTFEVTLAAPATVALNLNHDPDFVAGAGRLVADAGRLAVELPAGHHRVVVSHDRSRYAASAALSASAALVALAVALAHSRRGRDA